MFDEHAMVQNLPRKDSGVTTQKEQSTQGELEIGLRSKPEFLAQSILEVKESTTLPPQAAEPSIL